MKPVKARRTLSTRIVIGLAAGIALGLLVGDRASVLNIVADGYIKLLQMTVLPFVTVSIIGGIGGLTGPQARALVKHVGVVLRCSGPGADDGVPSR
jgi:Na+/H+-dicarboxylate symporter